MANKQLDVIETQDTVERQAFVGRMSLRDIRRTMKRDPDGNGISALGYDGVLRTFDADRNVLDAVDLDPTHIREYYDGRPLPERLLTADGRKVSQKDMFSPNAENIPKRFTKDEIAKTETHKKEVQERENASCISTTSADNNGLNCQ
ncbi:hypothetical protein FLONG3_6523 [Fusarium longipes]|uniref:Uncharacterized protein n=1 Tax=Fusarium longipes TaxID=694270 RepID=A0A395SL83_9HYPO|nr:hypothetical protein FLONG3_6523 [Fusarium longipes]